VTADPAWLSDVSTTITYGVPIFLLAFFVALWFVFRIGRNPPALKSSGSDPSWFKSSLDRVDEAFRTGRLESAIAEVQRYVNGLLRSRSRTAGGGTSRARSGRFDDLFGSSDLRGVARQLEAARRNAHRAEAVDWPEFVLRWLGPGWAQRAREDFERSVIELERIRTSAGANREGS